MSSGIGPGRAPACAGTHDLTGGGGRMAVEVAYRMTRLRTEAEHARVAGVRARRASPRSRLGRALMTLGRFVEGTGAREGERVDPLRA